jgi:RecB family endonuclease NucS
MVAPNVLAESTSEGGATVWTVTNARGERLVIRFAQVFSDTAHELGSDPGLEKDGVEAELQELLAARPDAIADDLVLVRREYPTDIGPIDLLCRDAEGTTVAVEVKRRGEIDGVEQLTRYIARLERDPALRPVKGVFVAQSITPQARVLASDRGFRCVEIDYEVLRGMRPDDLRLF